MMIEMRHTPREPVAGGTKAYWMSVISFKRLDWTDLIAKVVDVSPLGIGIEARSKIDPGFVWFSEKVDGHQGGLLLWSKQHDSDGKYRGGIRLVPLDPDEAKVLQEKIKNAGPVKDPSVIVDTILDSLKKSGGGAIVQTKQSS
jgi:hypothetical protein